MTQDSIIQLLGGIATSLITAILASWLTVRASLAQFYQEKWWEHKREAYTEIIESLYHLLNYLDEEATSYYRETDEPVEVAKARKDRCRQAEADIDKATNIGSFVIADEAVQTLKKLEKARHDLDVGENPSSIDIAAMHYSEASLVRECLSSVVQIAHRDLGVHPSSSRRFMSIPHLAGKGRQPDPAPDKGRRQRKSAGTEAG